MFDDALFPEDLSLPGGLQLSLQERAVISASFSLLQSKYSSIGGSPQFLAKVTGVSSDYYICQIRSKSLFDVIEWLYSRDMGLTWSPLSPVSPEVLQRIDHLPVHTPFTGNPDFEYKIKEDIPPEPDHELQASLPPSQPPTPPHPADAPPSPPHTDSESPEDPYSSREGSESHEALDDAEEEAASQPDSTPPQPPPSYRVVSVLERDRLRAALDDIVAACRAVPRGAVIRIPHSDDPAVSAYVPHELFSPPARSAALSLSNWLLLRLPEQNRCALLPSDRGWRTANGLDAVSRGPEAALWRLTSTDSYVTLSSLFYPGAVNWLSLTRPKFGFVYIGDGLPNTSVGFQF